MINDWLGAGLVMWRGRVLTFTALPPTESDVSAVRERLHEHRSKYNVVVL